MTFSRNGARPEPGSEVVGLARPAFFFNPDDFWAHGVNVGLELRY